MFFEPSQDSQQSDTEHCPPDSRVTAALDELDIPYHYLPNSQKYEIHYALDSGRSQSVYIGSHTQWFMGVALQNPQTHTRPLRIIPLLSDFKRFQTSTP